MVAAHLSCACAVCTTTFVGGALKPHPQNPGVELNDITPPRTCTLATWKRMAPLQRCMSLFFRFFVILKVAQVQVQGLDNGLALTPPSRFIKRLTYSQCSLGAETLKGTVTHFSEPAWILLPLFCCSIQWDGCSGRGLRATLTVHMILITASGRPDSVSSRRMYDAWLFCIVRSCSWTWQTTWLPMDSRMWDTSSLTLMYVTSSQIWVLWIVARSTK